MEDFAIGSSVQSVYRTVNIKAYDVLDHPQALCVCF